MTEYKLQTTIDCNANEATAVSGILKDRMKDE